MTDSTFEGDTEPDAASSLWVPTSEFAVLLYELCISRSTALAEAMGRSLSVGAVKKLLDLDFIRAWQNAPFSHATIATFCDL